mgnify:CR=1 FL=1|tara:strand:- start:194 stop:862 length:669 start_codon:yes stop_codon:yes gene_type:complete
MYSQIEVKSNPYSFQNPAIEKIDMQLERIISPTKRISKALEEDEIDKKNGMPPRFGLKMDSDITTENSGKWTDVKDGGRIWRMPIKSPGAISISLLYDYFHLPPGGKLHIYNVQRTQTIGAFTDINNKGDFKAPGRFATGLVYGDEIILEYFHPKNAIHEPIISIKGVVHGYKYIRLPADFVNEQDNGTNGGSGNCQVNINCAEGNTWQDEKRGVAMLLIND